MENTLPLSKFQYSIWKGQKLHPDEPLYNMVFTFDIHGELNTQVFEKAFEKLVENSSILRLVVDESNRESPKQVWSEKKSSLEFLDFTNKNEEEFKNWMSDKNQILFDLSQVSYYTALVKKAEDHFVWYINQHHLFTDAYCFQVIFNRFSEIYNSMLNGTSDLSDITSDKELYIKNFYAVENVEPEEFRKQSPNKRGPFKLYGSKFLASNRTRSTRHYFNIDGETIKAVHNKLAELQLRTLSPSLDLLSFLLTSITVLFSRVSNENKSLEISNIFSKRFTRDSKNIARPLLEILSKNISLDEHDGFVEIHQKIYSFLILRDRKDSTLIPALSPVILNFFDLNFHDFGGLKTHCEWHHCGHMDEHHYVRFHILKYKPEDAYQFAFDIKDDHESQNLGERLTSEYKNVVQRLIESEHTTPINQLYLNTNDEINAIQSEINKINERVISKDDYFLNVLMTHFKNSPDKIALRLNEGEVSYGQLHSISSNIAQIIKRFGSNENSKIVLYLPRSENYIYSLLGVLYSKSCFIPVPYSFPNKRLQYIIDNVGADLLIHDGNIDDIKIPSLDISTVDLNQSEGLTYSDSGEEFYTMYTSGSTGKPKGVPISQKSISNYLQSISKKYLDDGESYHMPLFTSVGFDLTMTSILLPLYTGGSISVYDEVKGPDLSIQEVINNKDLNCLKCTPSHLKLIQGQEVSTSIKSIIVGGENFSRELADKTYKLFDSKISIFNEYGPTEATVGCIVHKYNPNSYQSEVSVPIGKPLDNYFAFIANEHGTPVPQGVVGELCIGGKGIAKKYIQDPLLSKEKFVEGNAIIKSNYYRTGDLSRLNENGDYEYFGRQDQQIKIGGIRIETGEIEETLLEHDGIHQCVVSNFNQKDYKKVEYTYCQKCGLPSNYPTGDFDENNVCGYCRSFEGYKTKVEKFFKTEEDFKNLLTANLEKNKEYDCIMLYSGGKDSTYALGKLVKMKLRVLAFTLDNGYIPDSAKENITRVTSTLGVDHVFGTTPAMNEIFVDSLKTHCNVCNGCFKTIYNLSLKLAHEKDIPFIVTGLSRGQFFETKLSEEIFWKPMNDASEIENTLFEARQAYHSVKDKVYEKTDGRFIEENNLLNKVKIVDFYRYHDVTLEHLLEYINTELPWVRPDDTGRSTNCTINKVGIYVHKQQKGYSNYAFPYSWDVRTGHKTKEETIDEIEEYIDENEVKEIIDEIGYQEDNERSKLIAYYQGNPMDSNDLKIFASKYLPDYMIPTSFVHVDQFPLTKNGKVDLNKLSESVSHIEKNIIKPTNEIEELLVSIWKEVLEIEAISIDDDFFELGGTSLDAIRIVARLDKSIGYQLRVNYVFEKTTIQKLSKHILEDMMSIIASNSDN